ncbi:MAG: archease [Desulfobacteraceae bacterium]|nr:MAG: archease [Desulfobacteraceae bacterium]
MNIMRYEIIDHTADFGIEVWGADLKELFENAAYAMFDTLTDTEELNALSEISVNVTGEDWPDLMVNWLRELLYLWAGKGLLVKMTCISSISEYALSAVVKYEFFAPERHLIKSELKAVTYHQIRVEPEETNWKARIIFDV